MRVVFALMMLTVTTLFADDGNTNINFAVLRSSMTVEFADVCSCEQQSGIIVEHIEFPNKLGEISGGATLQIWLVDPKDSTKRKLLFTNERGAEVVFSDNGQWLFINNNDEEEEEKILLYRHKKGLDYELVDDLTQDAWNFLANKSGHSPPADHYYVHVDNWVDEHTVLLHLDGNGGLDVENWLCMYDVSSKKFSTDLNMHNKSCVHIEANDPDRAKSTPSLPPARLPSPHLSATMRVR
jgi:hypothetical protein